MRFDFEATERAVHFDIGMQVTGGDVRLRNNSSSMTLDLVSQTIDLDFLIAHRDGRHTLSFEMGFCPAVSHVINADGTIDIIVESLAGTQSIGHLITDALLEAKMLELADVLSTVGSYLWLPKSAGIANPLTGDLYRRIDGTAYKALSAIDSLLGIGDERIGSLMLGDMYINQEEVFFSEASGGEAQEGDDESEVVAEIVTSRKNITELLKHLYVVNFGSDAEPYLMLRSDIPWYTSYGGPSAGITAAGEIDGTLFYRLDSWGETAIADETWLLSAMLGKELRDDVDYLLEKPLTEVAWEDATEEYVSLNVNGDTRRLIPYIEGSNLLDLMQMFKKVEVSTGVYGIKAMMDLYIIQAGSTLKNISELLRHISIASGTMSFDLGISVGGSITASGNITAGSAASSDAIGNVLYRLDSWDGYSDSSFGSWVPSATLVNILRGRITLLEEAVSEMVGGGAGTDVSFDLAPGGAYGVLMVGEDGPFNIQIYNPNPTEYLPLSTWNALFSVSDSLLTILNVGQNNPRGLSVPGALGAASAAILGAISGASLSTTGNIVSGGSITAAANITAGSAASAETPGDVLYRLETWDGYDSTKAGWVPSAALVNAIRATLANIVEAIEEGVGGGTEVSWGSSTTKYVDLTVDDVTKRILLNADYLETSVFENIFSVTNESVTLLGQRALSVLGAISGASLSTTGNIVSGGSITAAANITAGSAASAETPGDVLYRLETWDGYDSTKAGWVPSAALVNAIRAEIISIQQDLQDIEEIDTTAIENRLSVVENALPLLASRLNALESRNEFVYVGPSESYPSDANMVENLLYVKLGQTSS